MKEQNNIYQDYNNLLKYCYSLEDERDYLRKKLYMIIHFLNTFNHIHEQGGGSGGREEDKICVACTAQKIIKEIKWDF